jgi:plastocyanin
VRLRKLLLGGLMAVLLVSLVGCGGGGGDDRTADVSIEDDTLRFEPSSLDIDPNQEQTFTFINRDDIVHNVTVPQIPRDAEQNPVDVDIQPGDRVSVKIPAVAAAPRDGFFLFYCKYHQTEGMSGRLEVSS